MSSKKFFEETNKPASNSDLETWNKVMEIVKEEKFEFGPYFSHQIKHNIKHLLFTFARYKFVSQMIGEEPPKSILELGCSEGIGSLFLSQIASSVKAVDFDQKTIVWAKNSLFDHNIEFVSEDFMGKSFGQFDVVVSLDVIEHISKDKENCFLNSILVNLNEGGFVIIGTPNKTASAYASDASKIGHINLYDQQRLKNLLLGGFKNVFLFGMNDEVVHTGFHPMCHYIFALACGKIDV